MRMRRGFAVAVAIWTGAGIAAAGRLAWCAPDYPVKPVRIITELPGSSGNFLARYVGQRLHERWAQPVVVENRGGIGVSGTLAARAAPDGYTLWTGSTGTIATAVSLYKNVGFDPVRDFAPIVLISKAPLVFVAHPSVPAANLREFIAYAKQHSSPVVYSSGGNGTAAHLATAFFRSLTGIDMRHVPYKGAGASVSALVAGEAAVSSVSASSVVPQVRAGRLKAYAVTSTSRFAALPDVPTAAEAGLPGFEATAWYGLLAPAKTPRAIIDKLNRSIVEILRTPQTAEAFLAQGAEAAPGTPEEFGAWIRSEISKWARVVKEAGLRPE
jgi:tripartite-type tricarboxylate transporter receptor subunit TctC